MSQLTNVVLRLWVKHALGGPDFHNKAINSDYEQLGGEISCE